MTQAIDSKKMEEFEQVVVRMAQDNFEETLACITTMFLSLTLAYCEKTTGDASGEITLCSDDSERKIIIRAVGE